MELAWATSLGYGGCDRLYYPYQPNFAQYGLDIQTPSGSISGISGQYYSYTTSASDPDGNQLQYTFDWGDGTTSMIGPFDSDISVTASHRWSNGGTYQVRAKATDADIPGITSGYSYPLTVTIRG